MKSENEDIARYIFDNVCDFFDGWSWSEPRRTSTGYVRHCKDRRHLSGAEAKDRGDIYLTDKGTIGEQGGRASFWVVDYIAKQSGRTPKQICDAIRSGLGVTFTTKPATKPAEAKPKPVAYLSDVPTIEARIATTIDDNQREPEALTKLLCATFGEVATKAACKAYKVGRDKTGRALFWYADEAGRVADGKAIRYKADGHRDRDDAKPCEWFFSECKRRRLLPADVSRAKIGLFGAQLLSGHSVLPIYIVEAEKTALIASLAYSGAVWVATGGKGNLHETTLQALRGRKVTLWADIDAAKDWRDIASRANVPCNVGSVEQVAAALGVPCGEKDDIADVLLKRAQQGTTTPAEIARAFTINPILRDLVQRFGLVAEY